MYPSQASTQLGPKKSHGPLIAIILLVLLLAAALAFGYWAFMGRQNYKNNSDAKAAAAVAAAKAAQASQLQAQYDAQAKAPYKTYQGSATYGTVSFSYPKTWSAYVDTSSQTEPINGYFFPDIVPGLQSGAAYALRVELVDTDYAQVIANQDNNVSGGTETAAAYVPAKLKGVPNAQAGTLFKGNIGNDSNGQPLQGEMLVIRVRDKTLQIYTQAQNFMSDFDNIVLPSLSFQP